MQLNVIKKKRSGDEKHACITLIPVLSEQRTNVDVAIPVAACFS